MKLIKKQIGWVLVMSVAGIMVIIYMNMYQVQKERWTKLMREIPTSAGEVKICFQKIFVRNIMI